MLLSGWTKSLGFWYGNFDEGDSVFDLSHTLNLSFLTSPHHMAISAQCEGLILISPCLLALVITQKKSLKKG